MPAERPDISLRFKFSPGATDPVAFFAGVSRACSGLTLLESALIHQLDGIESHFLLERVQEASLRAALRRAARLAHRALSSVNDDALKAGEFKKVLGLILYDLKLITMEWLEKHAAIEDRRQVQGLAKQLQARTDSATLVPLQGRKRLDVVRVLKATQDLAQVRSADVKAVIIEEQRRRYEVPAPIDFGSTTIDEVLAADEVTEETNELLLVKKPDFLTTASWEFRGADGAIRAPIDDAAWLKRFQERQVLVPPGSALKVRVQRTIFLDDDGKPASVRLKILRVDDVVAPNPEQRTLFPDESHEK